MWTSIIIIGTHNARDILALVNIRKCYGSNLIEITLQTKNWSFSKGEGGGGIAPFSNFVLVYFLKTYDSIMFQM